MLCIKTLYEKKYILFFLLILILSGCSDKPITFDDITGIADDITAKRTIYTGGAGRRRRLRQVPKLRALWALGPSGKTSAPRPSSAKPWRELFGL